MRRLKGRVFRRAAHGKLIEIRLSENDGVLCVQLRHDRRIIGRNKVLQDLGRSCRAYTDGADIILNSTRNPCEERNLLSCGTFCIHGIRLSKRTLACFQKVCADIALYGIHARKHILGQFTGADLVAREHIVQDMRRFFI